MDDPQTLSGFDVVVIGGGAVGCGVAWDLSLRGLRVIVVEKGDIATGTSGRYHGLLHSGARYAVTDPQAAKDCYRENLILKRIAPAVIDGCGGLFVLGGEDGEGFVDPWVAGCERAGIPVREISASAALKREPALDRGVKRVFEVPDAVCGSVALCAALRSNAEGHGARFLTFQRVEGFLQSPGAVRGVRARDLRTGRALQIPARCVVNAAGPWCGEIAGLAGIALPMDLVRGVMLGMQGRLISTVVNALQSPNDGDVLLPRGKVSIAGTTNVLTSDPADRRVEEWEIALVRERLAALVPAVEDAKVVHVWSAVRPLHDQGNPAEEKTADPHRISRDYAAIDHAPSVDGLVTIVGGKLTTSRLMAEKASDAVCRKLGVQEACRTAETALA